MVTLTTKRAARFAPGDFFVDPWGEVWRAGAVAYDPDHGQYRVTAADHPQIEYGEDDIQRYRPSPAT